MNLFAVYYIKVINRAFFQKKIINISKVNFLWLALIFTGFLNAQVTSFPYEEDFEVNDGGWIVKGTTTSWELGTPNNTVISSAASGNKAWVTNLDGVYLDNENGWIESPVFDFSIIATPTIEFSIWWSCEYGFDGAVIQSSIDNGASWQIIGDVGDSATWYNYETIFANPGGQSKGWTGGVGANGSNAWFVAGHAMPNLSGQPNVIFRMAFASDNSNVEEGFAFDFVKVFDSNCNSAGDNGALETCGGVSDSELFDALGGDPQTGGTWTAPPGGEFGTYTYTHAATAYCPESTATVVVAQLPLAFAGQSNTVNTAGETINLFDYLLDSEGNLRGTLTKNSVLAREPDPGGKWEDEEGEELPTAEVSFPGLPAGTHTKIYTYKVDGNCGSEDSAKVTVEILIPHNAGTDGAYVMCTGEVLTETKLFNALGGNPDSGGGWEPALNGPNTYTYTIVGEFSQVIVTEEAPKSAGENGTFVMNPAYTLKAIDLYNALEGSPDLNGVWTPALAKEGTYTYTQPAVGDCPESTAEVVVTTSVLGIDDIEKLGIQIFPNPTNGKLFLKGELSNIKMMEIYSMYGQKVKVVHQNFNEVNIDGLASAMYIVKLFTDDGFGQKKVLKK